jgi:hypothetical protein
MGCGGRGGGGGDTDAIIRTVAAAGGSGGIQIGRRGGGAVLIEGGGEGGLHKKRGAGRAADEGSRKVAERSLREYDNNQIIIIIMINADQRAGIYSMGDQLASSRPEVRNILHG